MSRMLEINSELKSVDIVDKPALADSEQVQFLMSLRTHTCIARCPKENAYSKKLTEFRKVALAPNPENDYINIVTLCGIFGLCLARFSAQKSVLWSFSVGHFAAKYPMNYDDRSDF